MTLQLAIVTPEKTVLNESVDSVIIPMIDGEAGVLAGHAPTIGRLGFGILRFPGSGGEKRLYIDGGFVQIANDQVNVLTGRAIPVSELQRSVIEEQLHQAEKIKPENTQQLEAKNRSLEQARAQLRAIQKA